jgi:hypothetical protein
MAVHGRQDNIPKNRNFGKNETILAREQREVFDGYWIFFTRWGQ